MGFNNPGPGKPRCPKCGLYYGKGAKTCGWDGSALVGQRTEKKGDA